MQTIIDQIWPLFQVVLVDLVLAGDNAIVVALAAAGVPAALGMLEFMARS